MLIYHVKLRDVKGNEKNISTQKINNWYDLKFEENRVAEHINQSIPYGIRALQCENCIWNV